MDDTKDGSSVLPIEYKSEMEAAANQLSYAHGITNRLEVQEFDFGDQQ